MDLLSTKSSPAHLDLELTSYAPDLNVSPLFICLLPDLVAVGFSNGTISLLDHNGHNQQTLHSSGKAIWAMAAMPQSDLLLSGGDNDICVWDLAAQGGP